MIAPNGRLESCVPTEGSVFMSDAGGRDRRRSGVPPSVAFLRPDSSDGKSSAPLSVFELVRTRRFWLRVLFALDVVGAGGLGALLLTAPDTANAWLFGGRLTPDAGTVVLGCVWAAIGLISIAGLFRPITFSPVLLVQFIYKLIWLGAVAMPAAEEGGTVPPVLAGMFAGWVVAVGAALPWRSLFASGPGSSEALRKSN